MMKLRLFSLLLLPLFIASCKQEPEPLSLTNTYIETVSINGNAVYTGGNIYNVPVDSVVFQINFSSAIDKTKIDPSKIFISNGIDTAFMISNDIVSKQLTLKIRNTLNYYTTYTLYLAEGENLGVKLIDSYNFSFVTQLDTTPKFPIISNESLLTLVQRKTFAYFWDYAHPVSGLARERLGSGETVTSGGSGFGIMTIPVAIERGFISRQQGYERMNVIVNFLNTQADRFHGAFPHWLNGTTGKVQPFSAKDNGADLVETAFLIQGLLSVQQYFKNGNSAEKALCDTIQKIWKEVEWNWFQQNGQQKLYWHWSPTYNWDMNMPVTGWNEGLIVYVLAASSPTYPITKSVYDNGFARNGAIKNSKTFYGISLPLGEDYGGPMFFAHYSFLGLNPTHLSDTYANYWTQNTAHAQINYNYCVANPKKNFGYSADCWGLTASDIPNGYTASSPNNDGGTIAPTAVLASFPYTPEESMRALHFFYYTLGDKMFGEYGFKDAFNLNKHWFADSYLAIDQGPIVVMIENYRTGLLWNLFMQNPNVQAGLAKLGFNY
ncbi:MAG: Ig-like domain-containing protein [Bacteroidales bacterium]|nr:Ig-like domain-containing protein [Bacteroidales bacterium]